MEINSTNASINFNGYKTSFSKKFENFMKNDAISAKKISDLQNSMKKVISQKMAPKYYMGEGRSNKDFVELSKKTDSYRRHFDCNNPNNFVMRVELAQLYPSEFLSDFNENLQIINKLPKSEKELQFKIYFKELDKQ